MKRRHLIFIWFALFFILLLCVYFFIPRIREAVDWRLHNAQVYIHYAIKPPEQQVFVPNTIAASTQRPLETFMPDNGPTVTIVTAQQATQIVTPTTNITDTPTATPFVLPPTVFIDGVKYEDQHGHLNYCGPANLSMALTFWGWKGNREVVGGFIKPEEKDKNVTPAEMLAFVEKKTDLGAVVREGGTVEVLKHLLSRGYPVLIEKGVYLFEALTGRIGWMGHYNVIVGYDDTTQQFTVQDSYLENGRNYKYKYSEIIEQWRPFNYVFMVVYPKDREQEVFELIHEYADEQAAFKIAEQQAYNESEILSGYDKFFAMFNIGTSQVGLKSYQAAAASFDRAFQYYASQPEEKRPWRMMWYHAGPYIAYFNSERFDDVIKLADQTLSTASDPYLDESQFWRFKARYALGLEK